MPGAQHQAPTRRMRTKSLPEWKANKHIFTTSLPRLWLFRMNDWKAQLPPVSTSGCSDRETGSLLSLPLQGQGSHNRPQVGGNDKEGRMMARCPAALGSLGLGLACLGQHLQKAGHDKSSLYMSGTVLSSLCIVNLESSQECYQLGAVITRIFQTRSAACHS